MSATSNPHVLLTRSAEDCERWAARLATLGATPIVFPCIRFERIENAALRAALAAALTRADWLVFTSARGVAAFADLHPDALPARLRVAAVGETTASAARQRVGRVDLTGGGNAVRLAADLNRVLGNVRATCVLALAENARTTLEHALENGGAECIRFNVYRTVPAAAAETKVRLSTLGADAVWLASPTAVTGFTNRIEVDATARYFTIGATTSAATRAAGLPVSAAAREPSLDGLWEAMQCRT